MLAPFPTYNHLWYVVYLFFYSFLIIQLIFFINSERGISSLIKLEAWVIKGSRILWAPYVIYLSGFYYIGNNNVTHALNDDWFGHFIFAYILILGMLFVRMPKTWQAFADNRFISLAAAVVSYDILLAKDYVEGVFLPFLSWDLIEMLIKWSWVATLIGFARQYLNFTNSFLNYCNGIVYPFFILHQTVIIIIGYYIIDWGMAGTAEFFLIVIGTFTICILLIEFGIKKSTILKVLFGLKFIKKNRRKISLLFMRIYNDQSVQPVKFPIFSPLQGCLQGQTFFGHLINGNTTHD